MKDEDDAWDFEALDQIEAQALASRRGLDSDMAALLEDAAACPSGFSPEGAARPSSFRQDSEDAASPMRALLMDQPPPSKPQASAPEHILCDTAHGVKSGHQTRSQHPAAPVSAPGLALGGERGPTDMDQGRREHGHEDTSLPVATPMASAAYDLTTDIDLSCVPTPVPMPDKPPSSCSIEAFSPELELGKELAGDGLGKMESNLQPPATRQDERGAGAYWVSPSLHPLLPCQKEAVLAAFQDNTLVAMPEGSGQASIAAVVMLNFLRWLPQGKVAFVAPARWQLKSQVEACQRVTGLDAACISDFSSASKQEARKEAWSQDHKRAFFCTPATLWSDVKRGVCAYDQLACLVVADAHAASARSDAVEVVRTLTRRRLRTRVLAFSSFLPCLPPAQVQEALTGLAIRRVCCRGERHPDLGALRVPMERVDRILTPGPEASRLLDALLRTLRPLIRQLANANLLAPGETAEGLTSSALDSIALPGSGPQPRATLRHAFLALRLREALEAWGPQAAQAVLLDALAADTSAHRLVASSRDFAQFKAELEVAARSGAACPKLAALQSLLEAQLQEHTSSRMLVCMSHRPSFAGLAADLSQAPGVRAGTWMPKAGASGKGAGSGSARSAAPSTGPAQAVREARAALAAFRSGTLNVLVLPPDCCHEEERESLAVADLVVALDGAATPHALLHLLGLRGRARPARFLRLLTAGGEAARARAADKGMARIEELLSTAAASFALPAPLPGPLPEGPPPMELQLALQVDTSGGCQESTEAGKAPKRRRATGAGSGKRGDTKSAGGAPGSAPDAGLPSAATLRGAGGADQGTHHEHMKQAAPPPAPTRPRPPAQPVDRATLAQASALLLPSALREADGAGPCLALPGCMDVLTGAGSGTSSRTRRLGLSRAVARAVGDRRGSGGVGARAAGEEPRGGFMGAPQSAAPTDPGPTTARIEGGSMADKENRPEAGAKPGSGDLLEKSASWASVSWQAESSWECTGLEPGPSPVASLCCNPVEVRGEGAGGERLPSQAQDTTPMALPGAGRRARRLLDSQTPPALGGICLSPDPTPRLASQDGCPAPGHALSRMSKGPPRQLAKRAQAGAGTAEARPGRSGGQLAPRPAPKPGRAPSRFIDDAAALSGSDSGDEDVSESQYVAEMASFIDDGGHTPGGLPAGPPPRIFGATPSPLGQFGRYLQQARGRRREVADTPGAHEGTQDEYDLEDSFLVDSDEEMEEEASYSSEHR
ncbi:hypothetical protein ACKKBG_A26850 [Auxenochlorella protothecoides x Auxenochlorella symbiontica]